jgi:hypothetical protein
LFQKIVIENVWEYWIYILLLVEMKMKILLIGAAMENGRVVLQRVLGGVVRMWQSFAEF